MTASRLEAARKADNDKNQALLELGDLQRDADDARSLYEQFQRARERIVGEVAAAPSARVIAPATTPLAPSAPIAPLVMAIALFAGVFFGSAAALTTDALSARREPEAPSGRAKPSPQRKPPAAPPGATEARSPPPIAPRPPPVVAKAREGSAALVPIAVPSAVEAEAGVLQRLKTWATRTREQQAAAAAPSALLDEVDHHPDSAFSGTIEEIWTALAPVPAFEPAGPRRQFS